MKKWLMYISIFCSFTSFGQDAVSSQFWLLRAYHNPATSALMEGDYRGFAMHRNQWRSVTSPFKTSIAQGEAKFFQGRGGYMGTSLVVIHDKAGTSQLGVFQANGGAAYHIKAGKDFISAGLSVGYRQRSITVDGLLWDSQYNGVGVDPTIESGELFGNQQSSSIDVSVGTHWQHRKRRNYDLGLALHHYGQASGFLDPTTEPLPFRYVATFSWYEKVGPVNCSADLFATQQGGARQIVGGVKGKHRVGSDSRYTSARTSSAVIAGVYHRIGDAMIVMLGYEYKRSLEAFVSYDLTTSNLTEISGIRGGWEIGVRWSGTYRETRRKVR